MDVASSKLFYGLVNQGNVDVDTLIHRKRLHRWKENPSINLLDDFRFLMEYLFTDDYETSMRYKQVSKQTSNKVVPPESKLDIIKRVWEDILPHRELIISGGKVETKAKAPNATIYNAAEMSDGERVIFYLIGQALAAPQNGVIVIDEPELHIHKSIQAILWDKIEAERPDCLFVYLTHDLDFAATRLRAAKICLRSFDGHTWDWFIVPSDADLPEEIFLEILGSRKSVLFVEGDKGSLDYTLFSKCYPNLTVIPCGGCESVIHATRTFSSFKNLHRLSSFGIIDRDFRDNEEIDYLKSLGVYVIDFSELENLFLSEDILRAVSEKLNRNDFSTLFEQIKLQIIEQLSNNKERLVSSITASKIETQLKNFNAKALGESGLKISLENLVRSIDVTAIYQNVNKKITEIINNQDYSEAIKIYNNKGLTHLVSSAFGFRSNEIVSQTLRFIFSKDGDSILSVIRNKVPNIPN